MERTHTEGDELAELVDRERAILTGGRYGDRSPANATRGGPDRARHP